jgi:sugar phosphate isomerase/epimerase
MEVYGMDLSRRQFSLGALLSVPAMAGCATIKAPAQRFQYGVQTYSFREMLQTPGDMIDKMIAGCKAAGLDMVELFEPTIQPRDFSREAPWAVIGGKPTQASLFGRPPEGPPPQSVLENRERIRRWRLGTDIGYFRQIGERFHAAGITVHSFNFGLKEDCTDAEVERGFEITKALGTRVMTASTTIRMAQRCTDFAARHRVIVGLHGHSNLHDPNQLATPESFLAGLQMSPYYRLNLDIGHFAAAGFDVLGFLNEHHDKIVSLHLKDRKRNDGPNLPFGQGDTPILEAVRLVTASHWPIPAFFEYEYAGSDSVTELRRMKAYVEQGLRTASRAPRRTTPEDASI